MFAADCPTKRAAFMTDMTPGRWSHVPANFFRNGKRLNPRTSMSHCLFLHGCHNLYFCRNHVTIFAASEPSSEQGRRKHTWNNLVTWSPIPSSPTVIYLFTYLLAKLRRDIADDIFAGLLILFDVNSEPDDHSQETFYYSYDASVISLFRI